MIKEIWHVIAELFLGRRLDSGDWIERRAREAKARAARERVQDQAARKDGQEPPSPRS